jgi:putative endonuclease
MTNLSGTLYTGVTNDLVRRVYQHKQGDGSEFTKGYKLTRLVFYESTPSIESAITREKQIKGWRRSRKLELIRSMNPQWNDLSEGWFSQDQILRFAQNDK